MILLGITACNEAVEPDPASLGYDYFPLTTGDERVYDVRQIHLDVGSTADTTYYQLMEVVGESYSSGAEESFRIERYRRSTASDEWQLDSVWSARVNTYQAIMVENNVPIIKISFPVQENRRWDGNAMNSKLYDEFKMIDVGSEYTLDEISFDRSLILVKEDLLDTCYLSFDNYHTEVYGKGIGMIHRIDINRSYMPQNGCVETGILESVKEVEYKLKEYRLIE